MTKIDPAWTRLGVRAVGLLAAGSVGCQLQPISELSFGAVAAAQPTGDEPPLGGVVTREPACEVSDEPIPELGLQRVVGGLDLPSAAVGLPGHPELVVVLEQPGVIRLVDIGDPSGRGRVLERPLLDLRSRVHTSLPGYSEWGLLAIAFHPDYERNGRLFLHYSSVANADAGLAAGDGVIAEFSRSVDDPLQVDPGSERRLLTVAQPALNHNGGSIEFGLDGMLYIGFGDGGGQGDPSRNGQNLATRLGKILRIDVDGPRSSDRAFAIPAGNMTGVGVLPEIWSYGFRNPWRFSFDRCTGEMYVADVGQSLVEEVNVEPPGQSGRNYGWNALEGSLCFNAQPDDPAAFFPSFTEPLASCEREGFTAPVEELPHESGNCSITGGYVYRGQALPGLRGTYFYSDYCSGVFRSFRFEGGVAQDRRDWTAQLNAQGLSTISSFGIDGGGELYVLTHSAGPFNLTRNNGALYRIVDAARADEAPVEPEATTPEPEVTTPEPEVTAPPPSPEVQVREVTDAGVSTTAPVGFEAAIYPILTSSCTPCHSTLGFVHNAASADRETALADSRQFGERIVARIAEGTMPPACVRDTSACVSQADLELIVQWLAQGGEP